MTWIIWPREGASVDIRIRFGKVSLSSCDPNWRMKWEEGKR